MNVAELLQASLAADTHDAWTAFVAGTHARILSSVRRVAGRYRTPSPELLDDLVQETYLQLCRDDRRRLRAMLGCDEDAICKQLWTIAENIALSHFRARNADKRKGEVEDDGTFPEPSLGPQIIQDRALIEEIDRWLVQEVSPRDRAIFWLKYRQGFTAKEIAALPGVELGEKGVESCLFRIQQELLAWMEPRHPHRKKGFLRRNPLGGME